MCVFLVLVRRCLVALQLVLVVYAKGFMLKGLVGFGVLGLGVQGLGV